jgi:hypothetical protein
MSAESHKRYIERRALREAQKAIDRGELSASGKDDFARLRIQTVEPWKRGLLALLGIAAGAAGFYTIKADVGWLSLILFATCAFLVLAEVFGIRKTVEAALNGIDPIYLFDALF